MAEQPPIDHAVRLCVDAWSDLSTCRPVITSMAGCYFGAVPWTSIVAWCDWHQDVLDRDAAMQLITVIRQLDNEHAEREARQRAIANAGGQR